MTHSNSETTPLSSPQWAGLLLAGITFCFVAVDQVLRGFVRLEEIQRQSEEVQRRAEEEQRRVSEARSREREIAQAGARGIEERDRFNKAAERETRRARIEARYRVVLIRFLLDPDPTQRRRLEGCFGVARSVSGYVVRMNPDLGEGARRAEGVSGTPVPRFQPPIAGHGRWGQSPPGTGRGSVVAPF